MWIQITGRLFNNLINNTLKELVVAYLKYSSTVCLAEKPSNFEKNLMRPWRAYLDRTNDFVGIKIYRNHSEIFMRPHNKN